MNSAERQDLLHKTEDGVAYAKLVSHIKGVIRRTGRPGVEIDSDEELQDLAERNANVYAIRNAQPGAVHHDELLTTLSVMYKNDDFIGDSLMPIVMTQGKLSGLYGTYNKRDRFQYPDDSMASRSDANEISESRDQEPWAIEPRALSEFVDQLTLNNQSAPFNELMDAQSNVRYAMQFKREQRQMTAVTTTGNYGGNVTALTGGDKWDVPTSDPGAVVDTAKLATWDGTGGGRRIAWTSLAVHNKLKRHPKILDTFKFGTGSQGPSFATRQMIASYFEVDEYLVAGARQQTANEGQTAVYARMLGNVFGITLVAPPSLRNAAFGYTLQDLATASELFWEPKRGTRGGYLIKNAHCDGQLIVAGDTSLIITGCIS